MWINCKRIVQFFFYQKWCLSNSRWKIGLSCSSQHDGKPNVSSLFAQHYSFMFLTKTEVGGLGLALSLWTSKFWWFEDSTIKEDGCWSSIVWSSLKCLWRLHCWQKNGNPFPKGKSWKAKKLLELVHYDICRPIKPASNGGKCYFITFIDDCSRKTWVYYKVLVEKEISSQIKVLRTDRKREYYWGKLKFLKFL